MNMWLTKTIPKKILAVWLSLSIAGGMFATGGLIAAAVTYSSNTAVFTSVTVNGSSAPITTYRSNGSTTPSNNGYPVVKITSNNELVDGKDSNGTAAYNVPIPATATFVFNKWSGDSNQIFLDAPATDGATDRSHVHVYQAVVNADGTLATNADGTYTKKTNTDGSFVKVPDTELAVFNNNTGGTGSNPGSGSDKTFAVSFKGGISYDTVYILVIDPEFTITNKQGSAKYNLGIETDIPFKTESQPATPNVKTATITGGTRLQLTGLTMSSSLEYNIAPDGVNYTGWVPFTYSDTSADIKLPSTVTASANATVKVGYVPSGGNPAAASTPVSITFKRASPNFTDVILSTSGTILTLEGLPKDATNLEYDIAKDGKIFTGTYTALPVTGTTGTISDISGITVGTSVVRVRVKADTLDVASDPASCSVIAARPSSYTTPPSVSSAQLNGNTLTIYGLPVTTVALEYNIAADGTAYSSSWAPLSYTGSSATLDVTGLSLGAVSTVQVRYAADNSHAPSNAETAAVSYAVNATIPLTQEKAVSVAGGSVLIDPTTLVAGANTVAVRNATGQLLKTPYTNLGFPGPEEAEIPLCGGTYGFTFSQASNASSDSVSITIPYTLPASTDLTMDDKTELTDSKVAIYMLSAANHGNITSGYQYWQYLPTSIDSGKHTATITLTGDMTGQDVILSVRYDVVSDCGSSIQFISYQTNQSITLAVDCFDWSGVTSIKLYRVDVQDTSKTKEITIPASALTHELYIHPYQNGDTLWVYYTDTDVQPGVNYFYLVESYTDSLGNISDWNSGQGNYCFAYCDSEQAQAGRVKSAILMNLSKPDTGVNYCNFGSTVYSDDVKNQIAKGYRFYSPRFIFADGDSQSHVTTDFDLPSLEGLPMPLSSPVYVTSGNTSAIKIGDTTMYDPITNSNIPIIKATEVLVTPQVDNNGNLVDTTVNLKLTVSSGFNEYKNGLGGPVTFHPAAYDTFTVPITVTWDKTDFSVELKTFSNAGYHVDIGPYTGGGNGIPSYYLEHNGLDKLLNATKLNSNVHTIVLDEPLTVDKSEGYWVNAKTEKIDNGTTPADFPQRGYTDQYVGGSLRHVVIDGQGKTLRINFDGSLIHLYEGNNDTYAQDEYGEITLKNLTIDLNGHNCSIFDDEGNPEFGEIILENCKIIGGENSNYGIISGSCAKSSDHADLCSLTLDNCTFGAFKTAAVVSANDGANNVYCNPNATGSVSPNVPTVISINNCTFDGGGSPGYGIVDQFGNITATGCTFKGYIGNVSTGWASGTDGYNSKDGFVYKGIPDGSPSAAVFADAWGSVTLSGNTFSGNGQSIWIRTNENSVNRISYLTSYIVNTDKVSNVMFYSADFQGTAYTTLNGITVKDAATAAQAAAKLDQVNCITNAVDGNQIVMQDASSPYNATTLASLTGSSGTRSQNTENSDHSVAVNYSVSALPAGVSVGSVKSIVINSGTEKASIVSALNSIGYTSLLIDDVQLLDTYGNPITSLSGNVTVKIKIPDGAVNETLSVFWYDPATGKLTYMNAIQENGYLVFTTKHFSHYVIAKVNVSTGAAAETTISNPKTGDNNTSPIPFDVAAVLSLTVLVLMMEYRRRKIQKESSVNKLD